MIYIIHNKVGRNPYITAFFHHIDEEREKIRLATARPGQMVPIPRVVVEGVETTSISPRFPAEVTIDWFEPNYFNSLPAALRARYINADVALPPEDQFMTSNFKTMKRNAFMKKYGNQIRRHYKFPSKAELDQMEKDGDVESSDDEWEDNDNEMDEDLDP